MEKVLSEILGLVKAGGVQALKYTDPYSGAEGTAILAPNGWTLAKDIAPKVDQFPRVTATDTDSFVRYVKRFADADGCAVFCNRSILAVIDYCFADKTGCRKHLVTLPNSFSEETAKPIAALRACIGKAITLDEFELMLQKASLVLRGSMELLEIVNDLEGTEIVKVSRSRTGQSVALAGNVKGTRDIPTAILGFAQYMGVTIEFSLPFRASVRENTIRFEILDNGALDAAMAEAEAKVRQEVAEKLAPINVFSGSIS